MDLNQLGFDQSPQIMNEVQIERFITLNNVKSDDSMIGRLMIGLDTQKKSLMLPIQTQPTKIKLIKKKVKKQRRKGVCDYKKNICGYITKKIIKQYLGNTYSKVVEKLCQKYGCSYQQAKDYYFGKVQKVTGPSHIPILLNPQLKTQIPIKASFRQFFGWFLKERYMRYLLLQGKMQKKQAYIQYKNSCLMNFIQEDKNSQRSQKSMGSLYP